MDNNIDKGDFKEILGDSISLDDVIYDHKELMSEDEFKENLDKNLNRDPNALRLYSFTAVPKFKSIRRAIKRGLVSPTGIIYPKRPFNNRKNTCKRKERNSRDMNNKKKIIYEEIYSK